MPKGTPSIVVRVEISRKTALRIIDEIMANYPEAGQGTALQVMDWNYQKRRFKVEDEETQRKYQITERHLLQGFALMFSPGKWPKGLAFPPACATYDEKDYDCPWNRWLSDADYTDHDAFLQLATIGEVIYG